MNDSHFHARRPLTLVILDGWGSSPRTDGNAISAAHTPYYDEICRRYPMTTLAAAGTAVGQSDGSPGNAEVGHLNLGTGRVAHTDISRIKRAIASGEFMENEVLNRAYARVKSQGGAVHLIGLASDGGVHSSTDSLFACLRLAKKHGLEDVFVHCILDGRDVPERTADIYVEALEIKLADIGIGRIATLCGRFFAMDSGERWERTARAFTMLVHAEGERTNDPVTAIRNSFLRGIADEFISPIVVETAPDVPITTVCSGDLVVFFNHRPETMRQLARSLCVPDGTSGTKPLVDTVCLTEYDPAFNLPVAFRQEPLRNTLTEMLSMRQISNLKVTEAARREHLTYFFDGGTDAGFAAEQEIILGESEAPAEPYPESQSFKIVDRVQQGLASAPNGVFIVNMPAAGIFAETGDMDKTVRAVQYIDTCLGGIWDKVREQDGVMVVTSSYANCEEMVHMYTGEPNPYATGNPVPFHLVDERSIGLMLAEGRSLADVAPTVLGMLGIEPPAEMTGTDLRFV